MRDIHMDSITRMSNVSIHQLHEKGSHEHPEWRPPLSHQLNHTITEMNENTSNDNSEFKMIHKKQGSITYELDVSNMKHNGHVLVTMGEKCSYAFPEDKRTNTQKDSVVKELDYKNLLRLENNHLN
ncbi:hypothetical protein CHS0354_029243 [Potamilus streckersoni]|uniref:Uncharacterized protein n=1 Tax=Potamilus streckersoni TaxID=2493646 RepID=A0AAE0RUI8_9BIVA|nr:hypothetical protein CHS0354_029243 [Potamilus streckersoni]